MKIKKLNGKLKIAIGVVVIVVVFILISLHKSNGTENWVTATVERGDVQDIVSVSGFVEAKNTVNLSFPVTGIITDVFVKEGNEVKKGDLLATLGSSKLVAQRADAVAALQKAQGARNELVSGPTQEARSVSETTVATAQAQLANTIATEEKKVANARAALLSNDLEARTLNSSETATAPTISGSYNCEDEGSYTLSVYNSSAPSGFSYTLSGLEANNSNANTEQPALLGTCGLTIQFTNGDFYANSKWVVAIPNTQSSTYITYQNAYNLALQQETQNVQAAKDALALASDNQTLSNAAPSRAELQQVNASVYSAQARIAQIDAQIRDLSIIAPFDGMITNVDVLPGETAGANPVITLLAADQFELKARVPEIDITKIHTDQNASIVFDAQSKQTLEGILTFISPLATEIDGVAYFETTIVLDQTPGWIRSGLNADIDIIVAEATDTLRIPKRFLIHNEDSTYSVLVASENNAVTTPVELNSTGNNGYVAITGLNEGDIIIAP